MQAYYDPLHRLDPGTVRDLSAPTNLRVYHVVVWRNIAFFLVTTYGLSVVATPPSVRGQALNEFLLWSVGLSVVATPIFDIAALAFGVTSVRVFQRQHDLFELMAVSLVSTEAVFQSRAVAAWVRAWRWLIMLAATRGVLAVLVIVQIVGFSGIVLTTVEVISFLILVAPVVWTFVWWPLHRGRMLTYVAVQQAMIYRETPRVVVATVWYIANHLLVVAAVSGVTFYVVAILNAAFNTLPMVPSDWRFLGLWTFPLLILLYNRQVMRNARQDVVIRSRWDDIG